MKIIIYHLSFSLRRHKIHIHIKMLRQRIKITYRFTH